MESEIIYALSTLKNGKASGEDNIYAEMLKLMNTGKLCQFNMIYDSGNIPADWLTFIFITISKKLNAKTCKSKYRLSAL
jgi:hypothetical protein